MNIDIDQIPFHRQLDWNTSNSSEIDTENRAKYSENQLDVSSRWAAWASFKIRQMEDGTEGTAAAASLSRKR